MEVAPPPDLAEQVARALAEDVGGGDVTAALVPADKIAQATVVTRESAVLCGRPWFDATFAQLSVKQCVRAHRTMGTLNAVADGAWTGCAWMTR